MLGRKTDRHRLDKVLVACVLNTMRRRGPAETLDRGKSGRCAVKRFLKRLFAIAVIASVAAGVVFVTGGGQQTKSGGGWRSKGGRAEGPVAVLVAPAKVADMPIYFDGVGTVRARNIVTVRTQVDGRILSIDFKEGQDVKKGDVLARLDPATYQAQLDQVVARRRLTEVQLENAQRDLVRLTRLTTSAVSEKTVDTQRAQVAQLEAQLKADDAAIANAKAVLAYTTVTAPIDGRTGMRMSDAGNLVRASDAGIVVITEVQPISVTFTLPQQRLQDVNAAFAKGALKAEVLDSANKTVVETGTLVVVDNQVDSQTGTVKLKADFPNADLKLWPGQFVNVRLLIDTLQQVVTVPSPAVQRGPAGAFVYVVQAGDMVAAKPVTLGQVSDSAAIIEKGLSAGEQVVTSGFNRLSDGAKVLPSAADAQRPNEPAAKPPTDDSVSSIPAKPAASGEARAAEGGRGKGEGRRRRKDASAQSPNATP